MMDDSTLQKILTELRERVEQREEVMNKLMNRHGAQELRWVRRQLDEIIQEVR